MVFYVGKLCDIGKFNDSIQIRLIRAPPIPTPGKTCTEVRGQRVMADIMEDISLKGTALFA